MGVRIGRIYDVDAQSFDIYEIMANYSGKVLIIHGTSNSIAPISYSERAAETFTNAQLVKIDGSGHGFYGNAVDQASQLAVSFILNEDEESSGAENAGYSSQEDTGLTAQQEMKLKIGDREITVAWEENESIEALRELVSSGLLVINMSMYGGFEQVGPIGASLPRNDVQTTTTAGDIVLYSGNQIVVFYGSNSWAYTRLGKIQGLSDQELADLLGNGNVTLTISVE
ncbi:MAG: cyclophilin-like fold protein [Eubacteriales bacterium]|nr:cyclophilin-like fold protein [Eubacteriales bacterium]